MSPSAVLKKLIIAMVVSAFVDMRVNKGLNAKGNTVGAEARFTVETFSAGRGDLDVTVINPDGQQEQVRNGYCFSIIRKLSLLFVSYPKAVT